MPNDFDQTLLELNKNLNILGERETKYGGNAPLELLNQIEDHEHAITLTEQARVGELSEVAWREEMRPLLVKIRAGSEAHSEWGMIQSASGSYIAQASHGGHAKVKIENIGQKFVNYFTRPTNLAPDRNLAILRQNVHKIWVEDFLNNALLNAIHIDLGLQENWDAVSQPFEELNIRLRRSEQNEQDLPPGTRAIDVYKQAGGSLLILGQPGSGKTTTLATLARDLLAEAEQDPTVPVPVIFNLSSWAAEQKPLADWLAEELNRQYQVSRKLGQRWLAEGQLILL